MQGAAVLIILIGIVLRSVYWWINPPNNAYDDHLEVVAYLVREHAVPAASTCWECYQPPLYYALAAAVLSGVEALGRPLWEAWKAVQGLSLLASLTHLGVTAAVLRRAGPNERGPQVIGFASVALLPRDIFTGAFVSNDALLVLWTGLALLAFLRGVEKPLSIRRFTILVTICAAAAWTKQSGLLLFLLPALALVMRLGLPTMRRGNLSSRTGFGLALVMAAILGFSFEAYRARESGHLFVSNQQFFDYAEEQSPGSVSEVSFLDFRFSALLREPTRSDATEASLWTELFARLWFDYEPKLMPPAHVSKAVVGLAYASGLLFAMFWLLGLTRLCARLPRTQEAGILGLQAAFLLVPLVQTLRFPYFSSMKAMFLLPATAAAAVLVAQGTGWLWRFAGARGVAVAATAAVVVANTGLLLASVTGLSELLQEGPLWQFPPVR